MAAMRLVFDPTERIRMRLRSSCSHCKEQKEEGVKRMCNVGVQKSVECVQKKDAFKISSTKAEVRSQPQPSQSVCFPLSLLGTTACLVISEILQGRFNSEHLQKRRRLHRALVRLRDAKVRRDAVAGSLSAGCGI